MNKALAFIVLSASVLVTSLSASEVDTALQLPTSQESQVSFLQKNEKAVKIVIASVLATAIAAGAVYHFRDSSYVKPCIEKAGNFYNASKESAVKGFNESLDYTNKNRLFVGGSLLTAVVAALAVYDLTKETKDSIIKKTYNAMLEKAKANDKQALVA